MNRSKYSRRRRLHGPRTCWRRSGGPGDGVRPHWGCCGGSSRLGAAAAAAGACGDGRSWPPLFGVQRRGPTPACCSMSSHRIGERKGQSWLAASLHGIRMHNPRNSHFSNHIQYFTDPPTPMPPAGLWHCGGDLPPFALLSLPPSSAAPPTWCSAAAPPSPPPAAPPLSPETAMPRGLWQACGSGALGGRGCCSCTSG
jgi:hypothetical protein